ncbi:hypothetical protein [Persicirhabdus sediminis]|uniref:Uncharacterized protein n=1 Tax=Persicirhabdus sediminis TaxID=454144 RepID=A0A8J7SPY7_9BACT|nr:hypothetical protein [Persicirhabdus sediminis]MBK1792663.1 hypothetical protein [Persicirhabdus sediminis]
MKYTHIVNIAISMILVACNAGSLEVSEYDHVTKTTSKKRYSKYYDDGDWALRNKVGVSLVVDHKKKVIPGWQGVKQSMGALGPEDAWAEGKVTLYIWNRTDTPQSIRFVTTTIKDQELKSNGNVITVPPNTRMGGAIGSVKIFNSGTELPSEIQYILNGQTRVLKLNLKRRTYEELKLYFSPNGKPPYPWID